MRHAGLHQRPESLAGATRADTGTTLVVPDTDLGGTHQVPAHALWSGSCPVLLSSSCDGHKRIVVTGWWEPLVPKMPMGICVQGILSKHPAPLHVHVSSSQGAAFAAFEWFSLEQCPKTY